MKRLLPWKRHPIRVNRLLLLALCASCAGPASVEAAFTGIEVRLDIPPVTRNPLGPEASSGIANAYELFVLGSGDIAARKSLAPGASSAIPLSPGEYRLMALAGYRKSSGASTVSLVGACFRAEPVMVAEGSNQTVSLSLKPIDLSFDVPHEAYLGEPYEIIAAGSAGSPHIGMSLAGSTSERPRLKSAYLWNGYKDFTELSQDAGAWMARYAAVSAAAPGLADVEFHGSYVSLIGLGPLDGSLYGRSTFIWKWPSQADMAAGGPLEFLTKRTLEAKEALTGLSIGIGWE
jgi:hypothetical protein